jgi:hypothetical protein
MFLYLLEIFIENIEMFIAFSEMFLKSLEMFLDFLETFLILLLLWQKTGFSCVNVPQIAVCECGLCREK